MRIAVVTNIITPYRKRFYDEMFTQLRTAGDEFRVYAMTDSLPLRPWTFEDLKSSYMTLLPGKKIVLKMQDMDILFNPKVNRYIREFNPDIAILAGSWTYPNIMQMVFWKNNGTKYLFWAESHEHRAGKTEVRSKGLLRWLKKSLYEKFDGFCVPGRYANESITRIVGKKGLRLRLPNLVDNDYYIEANGMRQDRESLRKKYKLPNDKVAFITPSRLIPRKGIDMFLNSIKGLSENNSSIFLLAGEGPLESSIKQIAEEGGIEVRLLGYCNQETVRELYAVSDIFLLPSLSDPNPLTVIEAAFAGLPLLVSEYTGNNPELCHNGVNGIVFKTDNPASVKSAYTEIMSKSKGWLQQAGTDSLRIAKDNFDCRNEVSKFIELLKTI